MSADLAGTDPTVDPALGPDEGASPLAVDDVLGAVDERVRAVDGAVRRFVVERPVVVLIGALAGGFLIGRLLTR